ncbi:sensor histidine kinase [Cellulosilyticum ruminicola]|uniref:sensor histidine kinase n=1 Tax=Cellulosilyticum ruminicola TaxID=425254 RepID=UPI0006D079B3|nr:sensor histidine kinase [Cellulosilyticum ruminicola]
MGEKSIRWILIRNYLIIMAISLAIGSIIIGTINKQRVQCREYLEDTQTLKRTTVILDLLIEEVKGQSIEIVVDEEIQSVLNDTLKARQNIVKSILHKYMIKDNDLSAIYIIDSYNNVMCTSNVSVENNERDFLKKFDFMSIRQKEGDCYIALATYPNDIPTIYIARSIRSRETGDILGYLFLFIDTDYLREKLSGILEKIDFEMLIADKSGTVISLPKGNRLDRVYKQIIGNTAKAKVKKEWESKYHHIELEDSESNIRIIGKYIGQRKDNTLEIILLGVHFINMVFFILAIFFIGKQVIYPLEKIAMCADEIATDSKNIGGFEDDGNYKEISSICHALNEMLHRIQLLVRQAKEKERMLKALELSMINYQVNPHFLYNTLNSVSVLVAIEDKEHAVELIKSLARYYRACLNKEKELNTVAQEIEIAKEYLNIALLKNPNLFEVMYEVEEGVNEYMMPRMTIQILVENAVKYAIRTINEPLQIYVGVKNDIAQERFIVEVRDNGKGIDEETVEHIIKDEKIHSESGFGLRSIIKRIQIIYNMQNIEEIIRIETIIGHYTKIKLYIPWKVYKSEFENMSSIDW